MRSLLVLFVLVALAMANGEEEHHHHHHHHHDGPEYCSEYLGFPMFVDFPTYPNEDFMFIQDEDWVPFYYEGGIPVPIETLQNLVCDMGNTMLWNAEDEYAIFQLSSTTARTLFTTLSPYWQIMHTSCLFDQTTGIYAQYINDEYSNYPISVSRLLFTEFQGFTYVQMEYDMPEWTLENIQEYFNLDDVSDAWDYVRENMEIELGRIYTLATAECEAEPL